MRIVIQRVERAAVRVDEEIVGQVGKGLMVLVGVEDADTEDDIKYLAAKIANMRVFDDESGVMNLSLLDVEGGVLVVSQFTLHAFTAKGNRPSYIRASKGSVAEPKYLRLCQELEIILEHPVARGKFGADMKVELVNDGPVTIIMDSKNKQL